MNFSKELVGATNQMLVLTVLEKDELHGYEIVRRIGELSRSAFDWKEGTVYPVLHKMEKAELIEGRWVTGETGKRRRVYAITWKGTRQLASRKKEWKAYSTTVTQILEAHYA
jgi:DNA-binding PadR family transcriptional regulator